MLDLASAALTTDIRRNARFLIHASTLHSSRSEVGVREEGRGSVRPSDQALAATARAGKWSGAGLSVQ